MALEQLQQLLPLTSTSESSRPSWSLIHFDVHCARCGHDLRGQTDPVCPACHLEFSWAQAAPLDQLTCANCSYQLYGLIDSRCPECGTPIDWNEALLRYRRREKKIFEYRWRDRPIRSFFGTWFRAFRPFRLWSRINLHDPPEVRPLLVWALIVLGLVAFLTPVAYGLALWSREYLRACMAGVVGVSYSDIPAYALRLFHFREGYALGASITLYAVFSLAALLVFQQSMAICKVKSPHVIRAVCYSVVGLLPLFSILFLVVEFSIDAWYRGTFGQWIMYSTWGILLRPFLHLAAFVVIATLALAIAYRRYIRMPHSIWVAASSQAIAVMGIAAFFSLLGRLFGN